MRFLIAALALALSGANAAAVRPVTRDDEEVLFNFDILDEPHCEVPLTQTPVANRQLVASDFQGFQAASNSSGCHFFGAGTAPIPVTGIFVNDLSPDCELDFYLDEECATSPARPGKGTCVFNQNKFLAFGFDCTN